MTQYTGNKSCPGCGKPGHEEKRKSVDSLCYTCEDVLRLGKMTLARNKEDHEVYYRVNIYPFYISGGDKVYEAIRNMAKFLHDGTRNSQDSKYLGNHSSNNGITVTITKGQFESLEILYREVITSLKDVYKKGVDYGKNLLFQLNTGDITLGEFDEKLRR